MEKQIENLVKQNELIYNSLIARNIPNIGNLTLFDNIISLEQQKDILLTENIKLKELVKSCKHELPKKEKSNHIHQPKK